MRSIFLMIALLAAQAAAAQDADDLERLQERMPRAAENETMQQELAWRVARPLPVNEADADALAALGILSPLQIQALLEHRRLFGPLAAVEELQVLPHWDAATVERVRRYLVVGTRTAMPERSAHQLTIRWSRQFASASGNDGWLGSADRFYFRYRHRRAVGISWGLTAEKDPGEPWLRRGRPDFLSAHLGGAGRGWLRQWVVGDFQLNMGQGLVQWGSFAIDPGPELSLLKRQAPQLQPHTAGDGFRFHRGAAALLGRRRWSLLAYASQRHFDGSVQRDSLGNTRARALSDAGLHRTAGERAARAAIGATGMGARLQWEAGRLRLGVHAHHLALDVPLQPRAEPYRLFDPAGDRFFNVAADWSLSLGGMHLFGEAAADKQRRLAFVQGLLLGTRHWDLGLLYRHYPESYTHIYGDPPARRPGGQNEEGLYLALECRPASRWQVQLWADAWRAPWLRYRVNAPTSGVRSGLQLRWRPVRRLEVTWRYQEADEEGPSGFGLLKAPAALRWRALRFTVADERRSGLVLVCRVDAAWQNGGGSFVWSGGGRWRAGRGSCSLRLQCFGASSAQPPFYLSDPDVTGGNSVAVISGTGQRLALLYHRPLSSGLRCSARVAVLHRRDDSGGALVSYECKFGLQAGF